MEYELGDRKKLIEEKLNVYLQEMHQMIVN